jgi:hypothetical protein
MLRKESTWPNVHYHEAFWCSCLVASIGYVHECNFLTALDFLDRGFVLGLPRVNESVRDFFAYVECHAAGRAVGPFPSAFSSKSVYGLQGNMSEVDGEQEDWEKHPSAKEAAYTEVLLLPGDCLYIPARTWHYVRSLSTSVSINFWFG